MTIEYQGAGTIEERLDKLERRAREIWLWRVAGLTSIILGLATLLVAWYVASARGAI